MIVDPTSDVLAELGRGDEVAVAERLKEETTALVALLTDLPAEDARFTDECLAELLAATSTQCESFLTVAFPVVEYAHRAALEQLPRALCHVTRATAAASIEQSARHHATVPAVGRLVWALAAYALHCDRPEALVALARAHITVPFTDGEVQSVIALTELRYPRVLGGNAGRSVRDYHDWLANLALLKRFPLFRDDLDLAFREGDLVLAMCSGRLRSRVYTGGRDRDTVRRLICRVNDRPQRTALEQLFPGEGDLNDRLELAYAATEGDHNFRAPIRLFTEE